jgi:Flp pilus assembly protein TadG
VRSQARMAARRDRLPRTSNAIGALSNERGATAVEFALVLPVICLLVFGVIQFGITLNHYIELTNFVASGARQLAVSRIPGSTANPYATISGVCTSDPTAVICQAAPNILSTKMTLTMTVNGTACTSSSCAQTSFVQGALAVVKATYPCDLNFWKISFTNCTLSASSTQTIQ